MKNVFIIVLSFIFIFLILTGCPPTPPEPTPEPAPEYTEHCSDISQDETWYAEDNPHIVTCDIDVRDNATLTLEPGVIVNFNTGKHLRIGYYSPGALVADGSAGQITFTASTSSPSPGDWDGIVFWDDTIDPATVLNNCIIEYAGGNNYGNIRCSNASPRITNCTINFSLHWGIYLHNSNPLMSGNSFIANSGGNIYTNQ